MAGLLSIALAELSVFHVYLACRRISTYEYIVAQVLNSSHHRMNGLL